MPATARAVLFAVGLLVTGALRPREEPAAPDESPVTHWLAPDHLTEDGRALLELVARAPEQGLAPEDYDEDSLLRLTVAYLDGTVDAPTASAAFDEALRAMATDRLKGRVPAARLHRRWGDPTQHVDLEAFLDGMLAADQFPEGLEALDPIEPEFDRLRQELSTLDPLDARVVVLRRALDRWRWMPRSAAAREIRVNIPAYRLELLEDGAVIDRMKVVVGKPDWETPLLRDEVRQVVLNPDWHVPTSIVLEEIAPKARRDPDVLAPYEITAVVDGHPQRIDPEYLDLGTIDPKTLRLRQEPGAANPLGQVKVVLGNDLGIYLHDTPSRGGFEKTTRALSHGCVRVERPVDLAAFVTGLDAEEIRQRIQRGASTGLEPEVPVRVTLGYWTAWPDEDGTIQYAADVYGVDRRLDRASTR